MKAYNKKTAEVNPSESIFDKIEQKINDNPNLLFK